MVERKRKDQGGIHRKKECKESIGGGYEDTMRTGRSRTAAQHSKNEEETKRRSGLGIDL